MFETSPSRPGRQWTHRFIVSLTVVLVGLRATSLETTAQPPKNSWSAPGEPPLFQELEHIFKSYGTIKYVSIERDLNGDGSIDPKKGFSRYEVYLDVTGRRIIKGKGVESGSEKIFLEYFEDGKNTYRVQRMRGNENLIDTISTSRQPSADHKYDGPMNLVLWVLTPGGAPVYEWIKSGAKIEPDKDTERDVILTAEHKGTILRCKLDQAHDWLPSEITLEGATTLKVSEFRKSSGIWYPARGSIRREGADGIQGFEVQDFRFRVDDANRLSFNPISRDLNPGALVVNPFSREGYFPAGEKGPSAREQMLAEFDAHPEGRHAENHNASDSSILNQWSMFSFGIIAIVGIGVAVFLLARLLRRTS